MVRVEGSCTVRALGNDVHGVNTHTIEYVFNLSSEGRTASQLRLELSMESNEKQVAVSSVLVEASSEGATKVPIERDRRKTVEDLNKWIQSIVVAGRIPFDVVLPGSSNSQVRQEHVLNAVRCQAAVTIRSCSLGSLLCLCECLMTMDDFISTKDFQSFMSSAPTKKWVQHLSQGLCKTATRQQASQKDVLKRASKYHAGLMKRGVPSKLTPFESECITVGLRSISSTAWKDDQRFMIHVWSTASSGTTVAEKLLETVSAMACLHTISEDNVLEREYCLEFHPEIFSRLNNLLVLCEKLCETNKRKKVTLTKFTDMTYHLLLILGSCFQRHSKSNINIRQVSCS